MEALLSGRGEYEVVGETGNGREAVDLAAKHAPDLVFMDSALPGLNGAEATSRILKMCPDAVVVALATQPDPQCLSRMLAAGAAGYVLKTCEPEELLRAVEVALGGGKYLMPELTSVVIDACVNGCGTNGSAPAELTRREREVLQLIAEGHTAKEIGRMLHVSSRTIDSHRQRLMAKLKVHSVAELTKCAIRMGLTTI